MKVDNIAKNEFRITLSDGELRTISQCMGEVCHGFRLADFEKKIGIDRDRARAMLDKIFRSSWPEEYENN